MSSRTTTAFFHVRPGINHVLFDYSPDMKYLEIVSLVNFWLIDVDPVCDIRSKHRGSS